MPFVMNAHQRSSQPADWSQLQAALSTYRLPESAEETAQVGLFADILTQLARSKAGPNWRALNYIWDKYDGGLNYARQGKLSSAGQVFAEARIARRPLVANPILDQLVDVAALPAVAYLYYKQAQFAEAESLLIESIDSDAELLTEGIYILEYHRVQQLHNLARLYFRQGRLADGARLIALALKFLVYGQTPAIGNGKGWLEGVAQQIPHQLRSDMLWQLTVESVGLFLMHPAQSHELCQMAFGNMTFWEAKTPDETLMLTWFMLTDQHDTGGWQTNMPQAIDFLTKSPASFDQLKLALVVEMVANQPADAALLQPAIFHFMSQLHVGKAKQETCSLFVSQLLQTSL